MPLQTQPDLTTFNTKPTVQIQHTGIFHTLILLNIILILLMTEMHTTLPCYQAFIFVVRLSFLGKAKVIKETGNELR